MKKNIIIFFIFFIFIIISSFNNEEKILIGQYVYNISKLDNLPIDENDRPNKILISQKNVFQIYKKDNNFLLQSFIRNFLINNKSFDDNLSELLLDENGNFLYFLFEYKGKNEEVLKLDPKILDKDPVYFYFKYSSNNNKIIIEKKHIDENNIEKENSINEYKNFENFDICSNIIYSIYYTQKGKLILKYLKENNIEKLKENSIKIASFNYLNILYYQLELIDVQNCILQIKEKSYNTINLKINVKLSPILKFLNQVFIKRNTIINIYFDKDFSKIIRWNDENNTYTIEE